MSASPIAQKVDGGDVARMRAAHHEVGRADQHGEPRFARGLGGLPRGREFGDGHAVLHGLLHMLVGGIVMAGQRQRAGLGARHDLAAMAGGIL